MTVVHARSSRRRGPGASEGRQALGFISPALAGLTVFTVFTVLLSIWMSLFDWPAFGERTFVGFDNYVTLFTKDPNFWAALRNSAVFTVFYVPLSVGLALLLALAIGPRIRGRGAFRVLFFIPVVAPMVANVLVWKLMLQPDGLLNSVSTSFFGIELPNFLADPQWAMFMVIAMSVWQALGYNMLILSAAVEQLPESVMEAARVDGARGLRLLWNVKLPMLSPAVFFVSVISVIGALQVFAQPQLLTGGGPGNATLPLVMYIYNQGFEFMQMGLAAAAAWVLFAVILLVTALQFAVQKKVVHYEN